MVCRYCGAELTVERFTIKLKPRSPKRAVYAYVAPDGSTECLSGGAVTLHHPADVAGVEVAT